MRGLGHDLRLAGIDAPCNSQRTTQPTGQVAQDIAEHVLGHDRGVTLRSGHQLGAQGVDMNGLNLDPELFRAGLRLGDVAPRSLGQHVGLVRHREHPVASGGDGGGATDDAADLGLGENADRQGDFPVDRDIAAAHQHVPVGVHALSILADDHHIQVRVHRPRHAAHRADIRPQVPLCAQMGRGVELTGRARWIGHIVVGAQDPAVQPSDGLPRLLRHNPAGGVDRLVAQQQRHKLRHRFPTGLQRQRHRLHRGGDDLRSDTLALPYSETTSFCVSHALHPRTH